MAYLALYRAFRPTTLNDVVRQEHIVTVLKNQIASGRIGHAYLFCGPRGTGKTSVAKIFASAINCQNPINGSPCGKCSVCKSLADPSNLDICEIDAASNNGVDEIRDLREKIQYPPVAGKYKVYIIDEVHMLSTGAFNALLKTLEEPPSHAVFILATTESAKIPATILSRCMRFDFKLIPQEDLEQRLKKIFDYIQQDYEEEAISAIARAGAGSVRDMLSVADTCVSYAKGKLTYQDVNSVLGMADFSAIAQFGKAILFSNFKQAFEQAESFLSLGKSVGTLVKDVMHFLNCCTVAKTCRDGNRILALPKDTYAFIEDVAKQINGHRLLRVTEIFAEVEPILKYSSSPRVVFETAVLKASMPQTDYDIESLLARIEALEETIKSGKFTLQNTSGSTEEQAKVGENTVEQANAVNRSIEEQAIAPKQNVEETPLDLLSIPPEVEEGDYFTQTENTFLKIENKQKAESLPVKQASEREEKTQATISVNPIEKGNATKTFGVFLRTLRRKGKNGVLFTVCMDLDSRYEQDIFVLSTESDTIYRSLIKPEHYALMEEVFAEMGIGKEDFKIEKRSKATDEFQKQVDKVKQTFAGVPVEVK